MLSINMQCALCIILLMYYMMLFNMAIEISDNPNELDDAGIDMSIKYNDTFESHGSQLKNYTRSIDIHHHPNVTQHNDVNLSQP